MLIIEGRFWEVRYICFLLIHVLFILLYPVSDMQLYEDNSQERKMPPKQLDILAEKHALLLNIKIHF